MIRLRNKIIMNSNDVKVVDISDVGQKIGEYVCPYCGIIMLPLSVTLLTTISIAFLPF